MPSIEELINDPTARRTIREYLLAFQQDPTMETLNEERKAAVQAALQTLDQLSPEQRTLLEDQIMRLVRAADDELSKITEQISPAMHPDTLRDSAAPDFIETSFFAAKNQRENALEAAERMISEIPPTLSPCLDRAGKRELMERLTGATQNQDPNESTPLQLVWVHLRKRPENWDPLTSGEWVARVQTETNSLWDVDGCLYQTYRAWVGDTLHKIFTELSQTTPLSREAVQQLTDLWKTIQPWRIPEMVILPPSLYRASFKISRPERGWWIDDAEYKRDVETFKSFKDILLEQTGLHTAEQHNEKLTPIQELCRLFFYTHFMGYALDHVGTRVTSLFHYLIHNEEIFSSAMEGLLTDQVQRLMNTEVPSVTLFNPMRETLWVTTPDRSLIEPDEEWRPDLTAIQDWTQIQPMLAVDPDQPPESRYFIRLTQADHEQRMYDTFAIFEELKRTNRLHLFEPLKTTAYVDEPMYFYNQRPSLKVMIDNRSGYQHP